MNTYIGVKLLHISAIMIWCAALLYLPGLFAGYPAVRDEASYVRLRGRTRLVYNALASPAAVIAVLSGSALVLMAASLGGWLVIKLWAVAGMVLIHVYCGRLANRLNGEPGSRRSALHLLLLLPIGILMLIVIYLVTGKPV